MTVPFVQDDGTIYVHIASGGSAVFAFEDTAGQARDVSAITYRFQTESYQTDLTDGPTNDTKILTLAGSDMPAEYVDKRVDYLVLDTSTTPPSTIMEGSLVVEGWD